MKRLTLIGLLLLISASVGAQVSTSQEEDEIEVRALVAAYNAARDQEDPKAIEVLFTHDADQLVSSGEWRRGREELVAGMLRSSQANPGDRTLTVETVRFLAPDIALADARYEITGAKDGETRRMWSTFVAVRITNGWHLTAIRNMQPNR